MDAYYKRRARPRIELEPSRSLKKGSLEPWMIQRILTGESDVPPTGTAHLEQLGVLALAQRHLARAHRRILRQRHERASDRLRHVTVHVNLCNTSASNRLSILGYIKRGSGVCAPRKELDHSVNGAVQTDRLRHLPNNTTYNVTARVP
ncbi:hypothetical protein EVAR_75061_1 [Eumeta japonica]|uniref:Uncharacterized protein n=1 Tax=Eumeta variegata TaxID=151549 RepID=A0A4C1W343_EUMVA|nr:hypothetical protein EVAR_75061_1 [Eumeta japonica]